MSLSAIEIASLVMIGGKLVWQIITLYMGW